jgi:hypothetical protein
MLLELSLRVKRVLHQSKKQKKKKKKTKVKKMKTFLDPALFCKLTPLVPFGFSPTPSPRIGFAGEAQHKVPYKDCTGTV